jgi:hypothetical protein
MEQENNEALFQNLLNKYKKQLEYGKQYYHTHKTDDEFIAKNRDRSKKYYTNNIDKKREYYKANVEDIKLKNNYNYYKKNNKLELFKERHPDKFNRLVDIGFIKD